MWTDYLYVAFLLLVNVLHIQNEATKWISQSIILVSNTRKVTIYVAHPK